ncbi:MAG: cbb3-type cytochrome c oxidase subunit 3 [Gammaproteobacteria bacterium]|jgi:cytochrome c oxidase cbb3-type subunit 4
MDLPTLRGLFTLVLMVAFVAIVIWAWSGKRRKDFDEAARLPLEDDSSSPDAEREGKTRNSAGEQTS